MKKTCLFFVFFLLLCLHLPGQIDVAWGSPQIALPKHSYITSILGGNDSYIFALKATPRGWGSQNHFYLDTYARQSMSFVSSKEFQLPQMAETSNVFERLFQGSGKFRAAHIERLFYVNGKFLVFTSFYSSEKQKNFAYFQTITENGAKVSPPVELDVIDTDGKRNKGSFDFALSEDKSHILIFHNEPFDKNSNEKFSYKVMDENGNILWSKKLELPYADKQFHVSKYRVDNQGNVFMLANIDKDKDHVERRKPTYSYSILAYFHETDQLKEYIVDLRDKFISDITFNINPVGDIVCAGFYSKSSETAQAGTFFLKIDKNTKEVSARNVKEFEKDFLLEFMTERKIDKGRELYNFDIDHFLLRPDGSAVMVAEQYFMDVVSYYNPATHSYNYTYNYYYNDIIVVGFDGGGQISLLKKIGKYQHSVNDGGPYASYVLVDGGGMLHFLYNDSPENIHKSESEIEHGHISSMNNPGRSVVVMVSMDMQGHTQRQQLLDNHARKNTSWFLPKMNKKISDKDVVLFSRRGKYYRFGRVSL
jgi:hypothetical protein